jgi:hypothetical protein
LLPQNHWRLEFQETPIFLLLFFPFPTFHIMFLLGVAGRGGVSFFFSGVLVVQERQICALVKSLLADRREEQRRSLFAVFVFSVTQPSKVSIYGEIQSLQLNTKREPLTLFEHHALPQNENGLGLWRVKTSRSPPILKGACR